MTSQVATETTLTSSANPSTFGTGDFTATVVSSANPIPTGTVTFIVDGAVPSTVALDGPAPPASPRPR